MRCKPDDERLTIRHATAEDVDAYYGSRPHQTLRALVACLDGVPVGIVGLAREGGYSKLFSEYQPAAKDKLHSMTILRAIKTVMEWVRQSSLPVIAIAQDNEPDSSRLMHRLGFSFHSHAADGDVFTWHS